jgi:hypothetical protein
MDPDSNESIKWIKFSYNLENLSSGLTMNYIKELLLICVIMTSWLCFVGGFLVVLGFELNASHLLSRHSTT